jgi:hypothetical protein
MNADELRKQIERFFNAVGRGEIEIYNEFSLQHEFGVWLRAHVGEAQMKIQFERPVSFFGVKTKLTKKEIDLAHFALPLEPMMAMEFKFPRAGQVPIQMFKFCQDVAFIEELVLKEKRFRFGCALIAADDADFYRGSRHKPGTIYSSFRDGVPIHGVIEKSTGAEEPPVNLLGEYRIAWHAAGEASELKYALVMVQAVDETR